MDGARTRGQAAALAAVATMVRGPAPHAVLLAGPEGVGKTTLALDLAAGLLCTAEPADRPCRACRACRLVEHGSHPDVHRLGPAGPGRQVVIGGPGRALPGRQGPPRATSPSCRSRVAARVAIIEAADRMNEDAQSALLKTLEEPPAGVTIVLCADQRGAPPADGPVALLPPASRAGRGARHRGDPRRPRARRPADRGAAGPARRRSPGPRHGLRPRAGGGPHPGRAHAASCST